MIELSYILATRNRLPYLRITLERLINNLKANEEIVVVDGDSTDGAREYLQRHFEQGNIHQFISEPDHNQAHGWNKALLLAKGILIKKIIDDDVPSYTAINNCKDFMLQHADIDLCISNCLTVNLLNPDDVRPASRLKFYQEWKSGSAKSFTFSDVSMLIRKSSLSYLGLYDTQFTMIDWEYALRCSYLKANIAYYTGYNALTVDTPGNVTSKTNDAQLKIESRIGEQKYEYKGDRNDISLYSEFKIAVGKIIRFKKIQISITQDEPKGPTEYLPFIYDRLYKELERYNDESDFSFIC